MDYNAKIFNEKDEGESTLAESIQTLFEELLDIEDIKTNKKIGLDNMTMIAIKIKQDPARDKKFDELQKKRVQERKKKKEENKQKQEEQGNASNLQNAQGVQLNKEKEKDVEENKNENEPFNSIKLAEN